MSSPSTSTNFVIKVERCEAELVCPAKPTPHELKQLSDIDDQESLRFHIPIIQLYPPNPNMDGRDPVKVIKQAVAETLVFYYPFAGRLISREEGKKLFVECSGEGILFVEANANVSLQHFENALQPPKFPCIDHLLFDDDVSNSDGILNSPLLLIQVTRLNCGGFIFAIRFNHIMSDGSGIVQFLTAIAEIAGGAITPSTLPIWQRSLLHLQPNNPDHPLTITCNQTDHIPLHNNNILAYHSFFFGPTQISTIRKTLPIHLSNCTTFELLSAYIWRLRTLALGLNPNDESCFYCVVNLRPKLGFLPSGYYGNAIGFSKAITRADELCGNSLGYGVEMVKMAKAKAKDNLMMGNIKAPSFVNSISSFTVSDLRRIGFDEVDYGWGKPSCGGPQLGGSRLSAMSLSYFVPFKNKQGEKGVLFPLCLPSPSMNRFIAGFHELLQVK